MGTVASGDASHDRWNGARASRTGRPVLRGATRDDDDGGGGGDDGNAEIEAKRIRHERRQATRRRELERGKASERAEKEVAGDNDTKGDVDESSASSSSALPPKKATAPVDREPTKSRHPNDAGGRAGAGAVRFELPAPLAKRSVGCASTSRSAATAATTTAATTPTAATDSQSSPPIKCRTLRRCGDSQVLALPSRRPFEIVTVRDRSTAIAPMTLEVDNTGDATATVHVYEVQRDAKGRAGSSGCGGGGREPSVVTAGPLRSAAINAGPEASSPEAAAIGGGGSSSTNTAVTPLYSWQIQTQSSMRVVLGWKTTVHVLLVPPASSASPTGVGDERKLRVRVSLESWRNATRRRGDDRVPEPYFARRAVDPSEYDAIESRFRAEDVESSRDASPSASARTAAVRARANRVDPPREKFAGSSSSSSAAASVSVSVSAERMREPKGRSAESRDNSSAPRVARETKKPAVLGDSETIERKGASAGVNWSLPPPPTLASARTERRKKRHADHGGGGGHDDDNDDDGGGGGKNPRPLLAHTNSTGSGAADPTRTRAPPPAAVGVAPFVPRVDATRAATSAEARAKDRSRAAPTAPAAAPKPARPQMSDAAKRTENDSNASVRPASTSHTRRQASRDRERTAAATAVALSLRSGDEGAAKRGSLESAADSGSSVDVAATTHRSVSSEPPATEAPALASTVPVAVADARPRVLPPTVAAAAPFDASDLRRIVDTLVAFLPSAAAAAAVQRTGEATATPSDDDDDGRLQARTPPSTAPQETEVAQRIDEARRRLAAVEAEIAFAIEKRDEWRREGVEARREAEAWEERAAATRRNVLGDALSVAAPAADVVSKRTHDGDDDAAAASAEPFAARLDAGVAADTARFAASIEAEKTAAANAAAGVGLTPTYETRTRRLDDAGPVLSADSNASDGDNSYDEDDAELWPQRPIAIREISAAPEDAAVGEESNENAAAAENERRRPATVADTHAATVVAEERKRAATPSGDAADCDDSAALQITPGGDRLVAHSTTDGAEATRARWPLERDCNEQQQQQQQQRDEQDDAGFRRSRPPPLSPLATDAANAAESIALPERVGDLGENATAVARTQPEAVATSVSNRLLASIPQNIKGATSRGSDTSGPEVSEPPPPPPLDTDNAKRDTDDASSPSALDRIDVDVSHTVGENFRHISVLPSSPVAVSLAVSNAVGIAEVANARHHQQQQQQQPQPLREGAESVGVGDQAGGRDGSGVCETKEERVAKPPTRMSENPQDDGVAQQFWFDFSDSDDRKSAPFREAGAPQPLAHLHGSEADGVSGACEAAPSLAAESSDASDFVADSRSPAISTVVSTATRPTEPLVPRDTASASQPPSSSSLASAEQERECGTERSDNDDDAAAAAAAASSRHRRDLDVSAHLPPVRPGILPDVPRAERRDDAFDAAAAVDVKDDGVDSVFRDDAFDAAAVDAKDDGVDSVCEQKRADEPVGVPPDAAVASPPPARPSPDTPSALFFVEDASGESKGDGGDNGCDDDEEEEEEEEEADDRDAPCFYVTVDDDDDGANGSGEDEGEYEGDVNNADDNNVDLMDDDERRPTSFA